MRGRIGPKREVAFLGLVAQVIVHTARLNPRAPSDPVDIDDAVHVLAEVHDHGGITGFAGKTRAAAARVDGRAKLTASGDRSFHVLRVVGDHQPDRHLPVIRSVRRIHGARSIVKTDLTADGAAQFGLKSYCVDLGLVDRSRPACWPRMCAVATKILR